MMGKDTQKGISLLENDKITDKEVVNTSRLQESSPFLQKLKEIIIRLWVSLFNKVGNNMFLGTRNKISPLENNNISSQVRINEQLEEPINGQEKNMENNVAEVQTNVGSVAN